MDYGDKKKSHFITFTHTDVIKVTKYQNSVINRHELFMIFPSFPFLKMGHVSLAGQESVITIWTVRTHHLFVVYYTPKNSIRMNNNKYIPHSTTRTTEVNT